MKCKKHGNEANSICMNCGIALCDECLEVTTTGKSCCSTKCENAINIIEQVANLTLDRATKVAKASAYGSYLLGSIFFVFAIYSWFYGIKFLGLYMGFFSVGMIAMGFFYQRSSSTKIKASNNIRTD